ncbi:MAG: hypothetical protein AAF236_10615 [Verrucomicrobiota bacterium]
MKYLFLIAFTVTALTAGCVSPQKRLARKIEKANQESAERQQALPPEVQLPVGTVYSVNSESGFVLIQSGSRFAAAPGTRLTAVGREGTESAVFEVTPARKGAFLVADVVSGIPVAGMTVLMRHNPRTGAAVEETDDEVQVLE